MTEIKNIAPRPKARAGYAPLPGPIAAEVAEEEPEAERLYPPPPAATAAPPPIELDRRYAQRQYTVDAVSPRGFPVHLTFADISIAQLDGHIGKLAELGYTPPSAPAAAAPAQWQTLPDGTPICPKHHAPMKEREKQGDRWFSHNVGTKDKPVYCKGYHGPDSPGYDHE